MTKKNTITVMCIVAVVLAALFTVTQLTAKANAQPRSRYRASIKSNEMKVDLITKWYSRNGNGCVTRVEFLNDPRNCPPNDRRCPRDAQAEWVDAIEFPNPPTLGNERLVGAGLTTGESDPCGDYRFTLAGSPGWDCDYVAGRDRIVCSCIGYYVPPPYDLCCDPTGCRPRPQ
jgi:hypothetical protein